MLKIIEASEAQELITELDTYLQGFYPDESNHLDSVDVLSQENVYMMGAFMDGKLVGIGAVKVFDDYGEMKRFYVKPEFRGQGLARMLMGEIESHLINLGIREAKLETGIYQTEAISLYRKLGYVDCPPFGDYQPDPYCVFMGKKI
ncbi:GNAT family N-acetyltransferase [Roseofilum reptotaenium CS-1145]|uniref:N-acetyltransferase domain-containing protein n=1 Tax=Roseofilum reptotaenium AO1-A TaxID=1925591 RepID=A0A1L9QNV9_9CYAN|nr:GNAT family N-acetyltransferase [Roseofilum reptotaenium]MDB9519371.1 GNAT family N-acetyltransferase [Roseofilum reptotaenium CS-1145]OJJ24332.1 hypothetical protein BI308_17250 [Roseofilum reptotaenium AO1-A]